MSKTSGSRDGLSEAFLEGLAKVAQALLGLGALVTLVATGLLVMVCVRVAADASVTAEALKNVLLLKQVLTYGAIGVAVGSAYLFWGEEKGPAILLAVAGLLFFAPAWVPMIVGERSNDATAAALGAIQNGGAIIGAVAAAVLVIDVAGKARMRMKIGVKADSLKYGKGVKEEKDKQNVFLGKCFQLPYCRKFVRERCPIYHARRTCWRERVGCMCEEEVVRVAMEGKPISKDQILDGSNIPRNHRLTAKQKAERCRNCVIYNEHQRHKYKAVVPVVLLVFLGLYAGGHTALLAGMERIIRAIDHSIHTVTITQGQTKVPELVVEALLFFCMLFLLTYVMKFVEYLIFKLKI